MSDRQVQVRVRASSCTFCYRQAVAGIVLCGETPILYCRACWNKTPCEVDLMKVQLHRLSFRPVCDRVLILLRGDQYFPVKATLSSAGRILDVMPVDVSYFDSLRIESYLILRKCSALHVKGRWFSS